MQNPQAMKNWKKGSLGIRQETTGIYTEMNERVGSYKWDPAMFQFECAHIKRLRIKLSLGGMSPLEFRQDIELI